LAKKMDALFEKLELARDRSPLPLEPPDAHELETWLIETRRTRL